MEKRYFVKENNNEGGDKMETKEMNESMNDLAFYRRQKDKWT